MSRLAFRRFIIAYVALAVPAIFIDLILPMLVPAPLRAAQQALDAEASTVSLAILIVGLLLLLGGLVAALLGLFRFRRWGRTAAMIFTVISLVAQPFAGPTVQSGLTSALIGASSIIWGAILLAAYYLPIAREFGGSDA